MPVPHRGGPPPSLISSSPYPTPPSRQGSLARESQLALGGHKYQESYANVDYTDAIPAGTVWMWALGPDRIPSGWAIMDGKANERGSGIDMTDKFVRGHATKAGETGGSNSHAHGLNSHTHSLPGHTHDLGSHTHTVSNHTHSIGSHTHGAGTYAIASATTGVTVDDHPDHVHDYGVETGGLMTGGAAIAWASSDSSTVQLATDGGSLTLDHTVNDSGHTHTLSGSSGSASGTTGSGGSGTTGASSGSTGSGGSGTSGAAAGNTGSASNVPAYATLIYIEKIE